MVKGAEQLNAEKWSKQAMEHLFRDGLPSTPNNFAIYFHYYSDENPNLKMAMDMLFSTHEKLTQQHCNELYQSHLSLEAEGKTLRDANAAIEFEIGKVMGAIDAATADTSKFSESLDSFTGNLKPTMTLEQIRGAVSKVVTETRVMNDQNQRLQSQLSQTTQQLTEVRFNLDQVHKESQTDPLTGVGNRKFFTQALADAIADAEENQTDLTLLMVDIDHFKKFNDTHGHLIGDQVLRLVARTLVENLKGRDVIARFGGEEFVILLPQTRVGGAEKVGNLLRSSLSTKQIKKRRTNETLGVISISIGATEYYSGEDTDGFIARADEALYKAKQTGRNKVVTLELTPDEVKTMLAQQAETGESSDS